MPALRAVLDGAEDPAEILRLILDHAVARTGADRGVFVEVVEGGELTFRVLHRMRPDSLERVAGAFSRNIFGDVIEHRAAIRLDNAAGAERYVDAESVGSLQLVSILCVPLVAGGRVQAVVHLESGRYGHFRVEHQSLVETILEAVGPAYEILRAGEAVIGERDRILANHARTTAQLDEERALAGQSWTFARYVGRSTAVRELETQVRNAATSEFPLLLTGESGTGKGVVARIAHHASRWSQGPFVTVFCPSLEKGLVESELFGHVKGAFTGADETRDGKVIAAGAGTLFLDEVGELPLEIQAKILRLLQEKTYERRGENVERTAQVRVIAATNRDLEAEVVSGRFRRDLFERLNFLPIHLPPLRDRREDIPLLLRHSLDQTERGRWVEWADEAMEQLVGLDYPWPGNVREIEQLAARLSVSAVERPVRWETLLRALGAKTAVAESGPVSERAGDGPPEGDLDLGLPELMRRSERHWLEAALRRYPDLSKKELAERLRVSSTTLYHKLKVHGLADP